jgi:hypothetical protein
MIEFGIINSWVGPLKPPVRAAQNYHPGGLIPHAWVLLFTGASIVFLDMMILKVRERVNSKMDPSGIIGA